MGLVPYWYLFLSISKKGVSMISSDGDICMWPHNSQPGSRLVFYLPLSTMQEVDCHFHMWKEFFSQAAKVAHDYGVLFHMLSCNQEGWLWVDLQLLDWLLVHFFIQNSPVEVTEPAD